MKGNKRLRRLFSVNTRMLPAKLAYILYGGNLGSHITFLNVFFASVGLSTSQAGLITGIRFVSSSFTQLLWGYISDYTGRRKLILIILCLGASLPMFIMPWVSTWIYPPSHYALCSGANSTQVNITSSHRYNYLMTQCQQDKEKALTTLFYTLLGITTFSSAFLVPLPPYIDTTIMNVAKSRDDKASYGGQRIFGSIGFSLASLLAGICADKYHVKDMSHYTAVFFLFLPITLMLIPVGTYLLNQSDAPSTSAETKKDLESAKEEKENEQSAGNISKQALDLLCTLDVIFFMATVLIFGLANNLFLNFSYLYVKDEMKVTKTEMTFVVVAATASEILIFPFTSKIIKILGGPAQANIIGMFSYFIRFILMSNDAPFDVLVGVQTLHSLGFALSFAALMENVHEISPKQINGTMNSIMMALFFSVSNLIANMLGGYIYQNYGGRSLFFGKAMVCVTWTALMLIHFFWKKLGSRIKPTLNYTFSRKEFKRTETIRGEGIENPISCLEDEKQVEMEVAS